MDYCLFWSPKTKTVQLIFGQLTLINDGIQNYIPNGIIIQTFNGEVYAISGEFIELEEFQFPLNIVNKAINSSTPKTDFIKGINSFKNQTNLAFKKVVLSRVKNVVFDSEEDNIFTLFDELRLQYPNCFVHLISTDKFGTWIGASPEIFASKSDNNIISMSLAGTKNSDRIFTPKEVEEQNIVTNYIKDIYQKHNLLPEIETNQTLNQNTLQHRLNIIKGKLNPDFISNSFLSFLMDLHPTPAVGGFPKMEALEFISDNEGHDRQLYSGTIGYKNEDDFEIYVNLRCGQITKNNISLYAGCGILKDSDPEAEWMETEQKLNVLLKYIK
jgi:isochorismate synthase